MRRTVSAIIVFVLLSLGYATAATGLVFTGNDSGAASTIFSSTNSHRSSAGLHALKRDSNLDKVARDWSKKMAEAGDLSHNSNVSSQIPSGWRSWGENVAYNQPGNASGIMTRWMNSSGHKANILSAKFTHIGVGVYVDDEGRMWATQVFAQYGDAPQPEPTPTKTTASPQPEPTKTTASPKPSTTAPKPQPTTTAPATTTPPPEETEAPEPKPTVEETPETSVTPGVTMTPEVVAASEDAGGGSGSLWWTIGAAVLLGAGTFVWVRWKHGLAG